MLLGYNNIGPQNIIWNENILFWVDPPSYLISSGQCYKWNYNF